MKSYLNDIGFSEIYTFNQYEHQLKITYLSDRFKNLKKKLKNQKIMILKNI